MIDHRTVLLENSGEKLSDFTKNLIPGVDNILGVRTPVLRELAKNIAKEDWCSFMELDDREYHECILLQGMVICYAKMEFNERLKYVAEYITKVTNWATCDMFAYKAKRDERETYWKFLIPYTQKKSEFGMRFAVIAMMGNFIDYEHIDDYLKILNTTKHDGYYLKMGVAWAVATCFAKYPERTMAFLNNNELDDWTYNKSLQKIIESFRVTDQDKAIIRTMKRK